jgi:xanthine dehydrogenase accessory factor
MKYIMIIGAGEQATGVAHRLFKCGFPVILTELPHPLVVRRTVSFASAIFEGCVTVEGVTARKYSLEQWVESRVRFRDEIPVVIDPLRTLIQIEPPEVLIDARLTKKEPDLSRDMAPLVIGLGPGMVAGENVHLAIETNRGHNLGRTIDSGPTEANTGVPGEVVTGTGTHSRNRVLRAPCDGVFTSEQSIADMVTEGQCVGHVDSEPVLSRIAGVLRGQIHPGTQVSSGLKIGDVDPRGRKTACWTISDKARTISGAVLEAVLSHRDWNI